MASEVIKLNLIPKGEMPVFHASQFDTGRLITCELYRGEDAYSVPEGYTVELHCRKVDNNIVTMASTLINDNVVTFTSTEQLTACNGKNLCEVAILDEGYRIGTLNFILEVEVDPLKGGINSTSEIHNLETQVEEITTEIVGENYYNKTEVDDLLDTKADASSVYTKSQTDSLLSAKADSSSVYTKGQVDTALALKADASDVYTKTEVDTALAEKADAAATTAALATKADKADTYTKTQVDNIIVGIMPVDTASGATAEFNTQIAAPLVSVIAYITATGGNGTPDNPNPINGYTEANITRCGVNLWELSNDTKYDIQGCAVDYINNGVKLSAIATYARSSYIFKVKPGQTYTLSYYGYGSGNFNQIYYNDAVAWNPQNYGRQILTSTRTKYTKTFTATSNTLFVGFYITTSGTSGDMVIEDFMLEVGNTATDFKPYNGQTYTIAFGQTVYGGVLDVTRGKLHVTHEYVDLGEIDWTYNSTFTVFKGDITGCINSPAVNSEHIPMCSIYEGIKPNYATVINNDQIMYNVGGAGVYVKDTSYTDASNFKTAMNGVKLVYELATPFDIDLTPEVISAIAGANTVSSNTGNIEVKYKTTIQDYIDSHTGG